MAGIEIGRFSAPTRTTNMEEKGRADIVAFGNSELTQLRLEPGWSWSEHQQPIVGTDSCELEHVGVCTSGQLHFLMEDGEEVDVRAGEVFHVKPGHDAWVMGREAFTGILFTPKEEAVTAGVPRTEGVSPPSIH
jgi:quercetin dioxygenase-like cupin family protein